MLDCRVPVHLTTFVVSAILVYAAGSPALAAPLAGTRPNIIVVITDDQGYAPVGRHGHPWLETPHLDRLHDASTRFTRFLVAPTCSPTRSALMTGREPLKNGVTHTIFERERLTLDAVTLPQVLQTAGYTTGMFGKWHLGDEEPYQPFRRGFEETFHHGAGGIGQAYDCSCADAPGNSYFNPVLRHNGTLVKTEGYCTDLFFTAALGWIDQVKEADRPFFAYIATNAPHAPFHAPPENAARFESLGFPASSAGFYGMIENIDTNLGRLLDTLEEWDLMERTVVIFMSDNGMVQENGSGRLGRPLGKRPDGTPLLPYNANMKGHKGSADEGGVRVPFFVRWDGHVAAGQDVNRVAAHIDLFPTLAALAGAELPPGQVSGRSLLPLLEDPSAAWPDRYLFTHKARWPVGANPDDYQWNDFAVRSERFRLVGRDALYDMQADPGQTTNVLTEHPDEVKAMLAAYDRWWHEARPLMVNENVPLSPTRPFYELYERQQQSGGIPAWQAPQL